MKGIQFSVVLEQPLLATALEGEPNSKTSLPFIPGSMLRGALVGAYMRNNSIDAAETEARRLFFNGEIRYLNAYPEQLDGGKTIRSLPVPFSYLFKKGDISLVYDFSLDVPDLDQTKAMEGFFTHSMDAVHSFETEYEVNIHTQRDARKGRALEGSGSVYRYQALATGSRFRAAILAENPDDLQLLRNFLSVGTFWLGGARHATYGKVRIESVEEFGDEWRETAEYFILSSYNQYNCLSLHCLSDVIIRDENGQYSLDPLPHIEKKLGVNITLLEREGIPAIFRKARVVGGFNQKWGLPLQQDLALAAGSVFVIQLEQPVNGDILIQLEHEGIGERRAEGFGRISFYDLDTDREDPTSISLSPINTVMPYKKPEQDLLTDDELKSVQQSLSQPELSLLNQIVMNLFRQKLDDRLTKVVFELKVSPLPSKTQLGRWRMLARQARHAGNLEVLRKAILHEKKKLTPAWTSMERARISDASGEKSMRLSEWMEELFNQPERLWFWLGSPQEVLLGSSQEPYKQTVTDNLQMEYIIRLLDGLFARLSRPTAGG
jgi:CRISPR-associated protein Csx10